MVELYDGVSVHSIPIPNLQLKLSYTAAPEMLMVIGITNDNS